MKSMNSAILYKISFTPTNNCALVVYKVLCPCEKEKHISNATKHICSPGSADPSYPRIPSQTRISVLSTERSHKVGRTYLVHLNFHMLPILRDSLNEVFLTIVNRLCIANSVLSGENSTDDEQKYGT